MGTRIPVQLTRFIGREQEIEEITRLLTDARLLTLTGPGGCGKTRLAMAVAAQLEDTFGRGVLWVDLAQVRDHAQVAQSVARASDTAEEPGRSGLDVVVDAFRDAPRLLILDNCEHVRDSCRELGAALLARTPVTILTTSREPLDVRGERLFPVPALSLPSRDHPRNDLAGLARFEAIELFIERAQRVLPRVALTAENAASIVEICRRLDGLPLAIELAAARVNVLTTEQIVARLDDHFSLLAPAEHLTQSPHQTLRAAVDWSYELLDEPERLLLQRLSVFAGGCSLSTVETVCAGNGIERDHLLELLATLINRSLLTAHTVQRGEARYSLLEVIRQYGQGELAEAGEWEITRDRHLECFLRLCEETEPELSGDHQQRWLNRLEEEYDNIRAALDWSLTSGQIARGLRMAVAIYEFWTIRGYTEEALAWLERLLARPDETIPPVVRANALAYAAFLAGFRGNSAQQAAFGREATERARELGQEGQPALAWISAGEAYADGRPGPLPSGGSALAWALGAQAYSARAEGDFETELAIYQRVIHLHREAGDRHLLGPSLVRAGFAALSLGRLDEARAMTDEALPLIREAGNPFWIAMTLNGSGDLARCAGDYARARIEYEESISLLRAIGAESDLASVLHNLAYTWLHLGDLERAHALFNESLGLQRAARNTPGVVECLMGFAALAVARGIPAAGARLLAAAVEIGGERVVTTWAATGMEYEHYLALARAGLDAETFRTEQAVGRTLSLEQAVRFARRLPLDATARRPQTDPDDLTPREREVATLVAQARSNHEIAEELVLSKRTVEKHVSNIRSKLGFTQRAQIVRWAIDVGLVRAAE